MEDHTYLLAPDKATECECVMMPNEMKGRMMINTLFSLSQMEISNERFSEVDFCWTDDY